MFKRIGSAAFILGSFLLAPTAAHADAKVKVQVLSAVIKDKAIDGASVILQKNGQPSLQATTDASGQVAIASSLGDNDEALMIIKKEGYSPLVVKCPCDGFTYAISPVMTKLDGMRIVLNWGAEPKDLDSHLVFPGNHIFWNSKVGKSANLDVDDVNGYGPETITIEKKLLGQKYAYGVHNYVDTLKPNSDTLSKSDAKVFVYIGQSLVKTYYVPRNQIGNLWMLFSIDERGEFHDINTFVKAPAERGRYLDVAALNRYLGGEGVAAAPSETEAPASPPASPDAIKEAKRLNSQGDKAHEAKNYDQAIDLFRQAVDLDPNYAQAYSNLAVSYFKANRIAEAIWANRKAIRLASGAKANNLRAASYYNIARIYETSGEWESALQSYQWAQAERPQQVYVDAIARCKAKVPGAN